jgi:hypothetical protein
MINRKHSRLNIRDRMPPASDHTGMGTCGGDWSSIRDSSDDARNRMLEKALNFLFAEE